MISIKKDIITLEAGVDKVDDSPMRPFSEEATGFCSALSKELLSHPHISEYPDVVSFAFWCRRSNMTALKKTYQSEECRMGRGLTFHIAPSNVPVNFAYSLVFALLAGNSSIVRLPSKDFIQKDIIVNAINKALSTYLKIQKRVALISYPSDRETTEFLSRLVDARIIWGGDETVAMVRAMKSKPRCIDVVFADRYSIAILNGEAVGDASEEEITSLANDFYNDTYLMDQNACSTPQTVFWLNGTRENKERFWKALTQIANRKYDLQAGSSIEKYTQTYQDVLDGKIDAFSRDDESFVYHVALSKNWDILTDCRGRAGYFFEMGIERVEEIAPYVNEKFQTITYWGVDPASIRTMVLDESLKGIDRIVPVGTALDIGLVWDGYDLIKELSRTIDMR